MTETISIHPRVVKGRTQHEKSNTHASPKRSTVERKITAMRRHCDEHPNSRTSEAHLAKLVARLATTSPAA